MQKALLIILVNLLMFTTLIPIVEVKVYGQDIPQIMINEVMPNPVGDDTKFEWIELYNYGETQVDLTSFKVDGSILTGTVQPNDFAILSRNKAELLNLYPNLRNVVQANFSLLNTVDSVTLSNTELNFIEAISYSSSNEGFSLERKGISNSAECQILVQHTTSNSIDDENSNYDPNCWAIETPPEDPENIIEKVQFSEDKINWFDQVETAGSTKLYFKSIFNSEVQIKSEKYFLSNGQEITSPFTFDNFINKSIRVEIELTNGKIYKKSSEILNIYPIIKINEFLPNPEGFDESKEWVEFYNPNSYSLDIANYFLSSKTFPKTSINSGADFSDLTINNCKNLTKLEANQYCIYVFTKETLGNQKAKPTDDFIDSIKSFVKSIPIETINYDSTSEGVSFSILNNEWTDSLPQSPGFPNYISKTLQVSEAYPSPDTSKAEGEWLEIYNYGEDKINLNGWYLKDAGTGGNVYGTSISYLPNITLNPETHLVINDNDLYISLNNSGDKITLFSADNQIIDEFEYSSAAKSISVSKIFDENSKKYKSQNPVPFSEIVTPGSKNRFPKPEEIKFLKIKDAKSKKLDAIVAVEGIVTVEKNLLGKNVYYIQDSNSGIRVSMSSTINFNPKLNQVVRLIGQLKSSRNEKYLKISKKENIILKDSKGKALGNKNFNILPNPSKTAWESLEGRMVHLEGYIVNNYSTSFDIQTSNGIIRTSVLASTNIDIPKKTKGDYVKVNGIISQYDSLYRILPRYQNDLIISHLIGNSSNSVGSSKSSTLSSSGNVSGISTSSYKSPNISTIDDFSVKDSDRQLIKTELYVWPLYLFGVIICLIYLAYLTRYDLQILKFWRDLKFEFKDSEEVYFLGGKK